MLELFYYRKMRQVAKRGNRMLIKRDVYLNKLIERQNNGMVKVITGIRRCGKSFLLFRLYKREARQAEQERLEELQRIEEEAHTFGQLLRGPAAKEAVFGAGRLDRFDHLDAGGSGAGELSLITHGNPGEIDAFL